MFHRLAETQVTGKRERGDQLGEPHAGVPSSNLHATSVARIGLALLLIVGEIPDADGLRASYRSAKLLPTGRMP
jgi:hypothetical protein